MAGELFAGAALGTLCSELYEHLENLIRKTKQANPLLEQIKSTLDSLEPLINQIESKNRDLSLSTEEIKTFKTKISDGIKLLDECSNDPRWYKKAGYAKKLTDLDEALKTQLAILTAQGVRDSKETLVLARKQAQQVLRSAGYWRDTNDVVRQLVTAAEVLQKIMVGITLGIWGLRIIFNFASVIKELDEYIFSDNSSSWLGFGSGSIYALFLARLGVLLVLIILELPKYTISYVFLLFASLGPYGCVRMVLDMYRQGLSCLGLCKLLACIAISIFNFYWCLLFFTSLEEVDC